MDFENRILYEDNHLIFADKPSGLLCQKDRTDDDSILEVVKSYIKKKYNKPGKVFLGLPHRLDRPTTGVICLCRTSKSLTRMTALFKKRDLQKVYRCIVLSQPNQSEAELCSYLLKDTTRNKVTVSDQQKVGYKEARLKYKLLESHGNNSLLEIELYTGRPHQIRAQLAHIGLPILGDLKYGAPTPLSDKSIGLHAYSLSFDHPVKDMQMNVVAPYPQKQWWQKFKEQKA